MDISVKNREIRSQIRQGRIPSFYAENIRSTADLGKVLAKAFPSSPFVQGCHNNWEAIASKVLQNGTSIGEFSGRNAGFTFRNTLGWSKQEWESLKKVALSYKRDDDLRSCLPQKPKPLRIMKVRKKKVSIRAVEWTGRNVKALAEFCGNLCQPDGRGNLQVKTLEGVLSYPPSAMIVRGVQGEFYGVPPQEFKKKYKFIKGTTYESRDNSPIVLAVQWDGSNTQSLLQWCPACQVQGDVMQVKASWGILEGKVGDYVLCYGPGDFAICQKDVFDRTYSRARGN